MLIPNGDDTFTGGPLDFICILRDIHGGRFHPCFVEEKPLPGPVPEVTDTQVVRCKSRMHHTGGFDTFEEAVSNVQDDLSQRIQLPETNVALERYVDWDSKAFVVCLPNWVSEGKNVQEVLGK